MAATRNLWGDRFSEYSVPAFPCPQCDRGNLILIRDSLQTRESDWMSTVRNDNDVDYNVASAYQFTAFLKCVVPTCGQMVTMHGDVKLQESQFDEFDEEWERILLPRSMNPAPPLATIPPETPYSVANELRTAFELFWLNSGACANRLRISVERIMDEQKVIGKTLFDRIDAFQKIEPEHGPTFDALRHVGNLGSHEGEVTREALLDSFEIYQHALAELFGKRAARTHRNIEAKADRRQR